MSVIDAKYIHEDNEDDKVSLTGLMDDNNNRSSNIGIIKDTFSGCLPHLPAIFTVLVVTLVGVCGGFAIGFSSPATESLKETSESALRLNVELCSWFGSLIMLAALTGSMLCGPCMERFGRRPTILASLCIYIIGWMLMFLAATKVLLFVGRVATGVAFGVAMTVVPAYLGEVGPPFIRGSLGTLFNIGLSSGVVIAFAFATTLNWRNLAETGAATAFIATICCSCIPESPYWLLEKGDETGAKQSFKRLLRGKRRTYEIQQRIWEYKTSPKQTQSKLSIDDLRLPSFYKPLLIIVALHMFQHFTGINAIVFYAHSIFSMANFTDEHLPALLVTGIQVFAMLLAMPLMEKVGRKKLLITSSLGVAMCHATLGACMYVMHASKTNQPFYFSTPSVVDADVANGTNFDAEASFPVESDASNPIDQASTQTSVAAWISLASILLFNTFYAIGLGPIAFIAMGEIVPLRSRGFFSALATSVNSVSAFMIIKTFPFLVLLFTLSGVFWAFTAVSLLSALFAWKCFPETKGKTLIEIEALFERKTADDEMESKQIDATTSLSSV